MSILIGFATLAALALLVAAANYLLRRGLTGFYHQLGDRLIDAGHKAHARGDARVAAQERYRESLAGRRATFRVLAAGSEG